MTRLSEPVCTVSEPCLNRVWTSLNQSEPCLDLCLHCVNRLWTNLKGVWTSLNRVWTSLNREWTSLSRVWTVPEPVWSVSEPCLNQSEPCLNQSAPCLTPNHRRVHRRPRRQSRQRTTFRVPQCCACHAKPPRRPAGSPARIVATHHLQSPRAAPATPDHRGVQRRPQRKSRQRTTFRVRQRRACHAKPPRRPAASPAPIAATHQQLIETSG